MEILAKKEKEKLKKDYFNLLAMFLHVPQMESRFTRCLIKWSIQIGITSEDMVQMGKDLNNLTYLTPESYDEKVKSVYHLVYMIYLDNVIEDVELEVAMLYAEKIGLNKIVVAKLFQSIATAASDGINPDTLEKEVLDFMKLNRKL